MRSICYSSLFNFPVHSVWRQVQLYEERLLLEDKQETVCLALKFPPESLLGLLLEFEC